MLVCVDSGEYIGIGYVMCCFILVKLLRVCGILIYFILKFYKGYCLDEIRCVDFKVIELLIFNV